MCPDTSVESIEIKRNLGTSMRYSAVSGHYKGINTVKALREISLTFYKAKAG